MTRSRASASRRAAIVEAALDLFDRKGFEATSIEEICAASGASNGSVYHHFGSKENIAATLYTEAIADYQAELLVLLARTDDAERGIKGIVRHFLGWAKDNPERTRLMLAVEHAPIRERARADVQRLNESLAPRFRAWLRPHIESGTIRRLPPDVFLCTLFGGARRYVELWVEGRAETSFERAGSLLANQVWRGLSQKDQT